MIDKSPITNIYLSPDTDIASRPSQSAVATSQGEATGTGNSHAKVLTVIG